jgi:hypothetical protein
MAFMLKAAEPWGMESADAGAANAARQDAKAIATILCFIPDFFLSAA